jgi:hypothetical protein
MSTIRRTFERGVGNDGATRYYEQPEKGKEPAIMQLDLSAWALSQLGNPDALRVTIEPVKRGSGTVIVGSHPDYDDVVRPT